MLPKNEHTFVRQGHHMTYIEELHYIFACCFIFISTWFNAMRKEHNGNKCVVLHIWLPLHKILNVNRKQGRIKNAIKLCVGFHLETLKDSSLRCQVTSRVFSSASSSFTWAAPPHRPQPIIVPHMRPKKSKLWWIAYSSTKTSQMASTMLTPRMIEAYILIL